jgi:site-specific recombinase XerD
MRGVNDMTEDTNTQALSIVDSTIVARGYTDSDMIAEWLTSKRSDNTRVAYSHDIESFLAYVQVPLNQVTRGMVQAYEQTLTGMEDSTISRKLASVKSLLTYAHKTGYLLVNVGSMITLPATRSRLAERILTREQVDDMIGQETDAYNHALLRLLYTTGIRVSEACDLMWRDVVARDNGKAQVTVLGKGGKERAILVSADTYKELQGIRVEGDEQVFPNLYARKAERIVLKAAKRAGIDAAVSPHFLRHANASHALDRGAPIHVVQSTLGHASLATTSKYTHARPNDSTGEYLGY